MDSINFISYIKGMQRLISFHSTRCYSTTIGYYNQWIYAKKFELLDFYLFYKVIIYLKTVTLKNVNDYKVNYRQLKSKRFLMNACTFIKTFCSCSDTRNWYVHRTSTPSLSLWHTWIYFSYDIACSMFSKKHARSLWRRAFFKF